jgi:hypothetical protein
MKLFSCIFNNKYYNHKHEKIPFSSIGYNFIKIDLVIIITKENINKVNLYFQYFLIFMTSFEIVYKYLIII